jgi:hypothetical protein
MRLKNGRNDRELGKGKNAEIGLILLNKTQTMRQYSPSHVVPIQSLPTHKKVKGIGWNYFGHKILTIQALEGSNRTGKWQKDEEK